MPFVYGVCRMGGSCRARRSFRGDGVARYPCAFREQRVRFDSAGRREGVCGSREKGRCRFDAFDAFDAFDGDFWRVGGVR